MNRPFNQSSVVRIWRDGAAWRAKVTDIESGQQRFFSSLEQLLLFWQEETGLLSTIGTVKNQGEL